MTDKQTIDYNLQFYRENLLHSLMQSVDGAIFQGNRAIEASIPRNGDDVKSIAYKFRIERFELSLYLQCLETVVIMVESFRNNTQESGLRFDDLQPIKSKLEKSINNKLLRSIRNAWAHPEKTLLGKSRDGNIS